MLNCRNCQYWESFRLAPTSAPEFGFCAEGASRGGERVTPGQLAFALDAAGLEANLYTHPDFGCPMGKPRRPDDPRFDADGNWRTA